MSQNLYRLVVAAARAIVKEADAIAQENTIALENTIEQENAAAPEAKVHPSYGDKENPSETAAAFPEFYPAKRIEVEAEAEIEDEEEFYEDDDTDHEDFGAPDDDQIIIHGVPSEHEIHGVISRLLPDFYAILDMVGEPDFSATQSSARIALPVWLSFNELSKYKNDPHYPLIRKYIVENIKPACFAALGKS
jgi:hypothetical protein